MAGCKGLDRHGQFGHGQTCLRHQGGAVLNARTGHVLELASLRHIEQREGFLPVEFFQADLNADSITKEMFKTSSSFMGPCHTIMLLGNSPA